MANKESRGQCTVYKEEPLDLSFPFATQSGLLKIVTLNKHFGVGKYFFVGIE